MTTAKTLQDGTMRTKAFLLHLGISLGILLCALGVIFYFWYPHQFILAGGLEGLAILAGVTLVLGPVLTLVIFNPGKKTVLIKLDLVIIALAQSACIAFGIWMIYQQRPLIQVLADDGVHVHAAAELAIYQMDVTALKLEGQAPHHIVLDLPADSSQVKDLKLIHELVNRKPFSLSEELFVPAGSYDASAKDNRINQIEQGLSMNDRAFIDSLNTDPDCTWLPLFSIHTEGFGCYHREEGVVRIARR